MSGRSGTADGHGTGRVARAASLFDTPESRVFYQEQSAGASAIPTSNQCDTGPAD
jgi:hypothetical protein